MPTASRRQFLEHFGLGLLAAGFGPGLLSGRALARAADGAVDGSDEALDFGELEPLVALLQETPPESLQPLLVARLAAGLELQELVAATALANARTFGGQDYDGYHAFMALMPALEMARLLPEPLAPLPVLKVVWRNATFMQRAGGRSREVLAALPVADGESSDGLAVRAALRAVDMDAAERRFAAVCRGHSASAAYDALQPVLLDDIDVHRIVLAWRAFESLDLVGAAHAHTLLRQSVRHCVDAEQSRVRQGRPEPSLRELLPALLEEHGLAAGAAGTRRPEDSRLVELADTIFAASREDAAAAMAAALAEGFLPADLGECLSLAGNRLLLNDPGGKNAAPGKPVGSVHGASVGVHASDAARAWRSVVSVVGPAPGSAALIAGAYHTAGQSRHVGAQAFPWAERSDELGGRDAPALLADLAPALEARDQALAVALVQRYGELGGEPAPVFALLLRYGTDADGALHAEKYFATAHQEFAAARPAFAWRHLQGLARVTASEQGVPAPGLEQARELLLA